MTPEERLRWVETVLIHPDFDPLQKLSMIVIGVLCDGENVTDSEVFEAHRRAGLLP